MNNRHRNQKLAKRLFGKDYRYGSHYYESRVWRNFELELYLNDPNPTVTRKPLAKALAWITLASFLPFIVALGFVVLSPAVITAYLVTCLLSTVFVIVGTLWSGYRMGHPRRTRLQRLKTSVDMLNWPRVALNAPIMPVIALLIVVGGMMEKSK